MPCKFFKQGACQAGNSCPFSHDTNLSSDLQPCKYFQKGNCKFGNKCALAHILSDGTVVNSRSKNLNHSHSHRNSAGSVVPNDSSHNSTSHNQVQHQIYDMNKSSRILAEPIQMNNYSGYQNQYQYQQQYSPPTATSASSNYDFTNYSESHIIPPATANLASSPISSGSIWNTSTPATFTSTVPCNHQSPLSNSMANFHSTPTQLMFRTDSESYSYNHNLNHFATSASPTLQHPQLNSSFNATSYFVPPSSSLSGNVSTAVHPQSANTITSSNPSSCFTNTGVDSGNGSTPNIDSDNNLDLDFEFDFIPSSLHDLLTPQELSRRKSRNSFSAGNIITVKSVEEETPFVMD